MQMPVVYGMVIAKKVILKLWKTDKVPQFKMWLTELTEIFYMERLWDDTLGFLQYPNTLLVSAFYWYMYRQVGLPMSPIISETTSEDQRLEFPHTPYSTDKQN